MQSEKILKIVKYAKKGSPVVFALPVTAGIKFQPYAGCPEYFDLTDGPWTIAQFLRIRTRGTETLFKSISPENLAALLLAIENAHPTQKRARYEEFFKVAQTHLLETLLDSAKK